MGGRHWQLDPPPACEACRAAAHAPGFDRNSARFAVDPPTPLARVNALPGDSLGCVFGHTSAAGWPLFARRWWPPPGCNPPAANARWERTLCPACGGQSANIVATMPILAGRGLWAAHASPEFRLACLPPALVLSFDGAGGGPGRCGGAAAVLWGPIGHEGKRDILATRHVHLGPNPGPVAAETAGFLAGAPLLCNRTPESLAICGDNPGVMACLAGWSRLRPPALHAALAHATAELCGRGWAPIWSRIPRSENAEADRQAKAAAAEADVRRRLGSQI